MRLIYIACVLAPVAFVVTGCATVPPEEDPVLIKLTELENRLSRVERVVNNDSLLDLNAQLTQMREEVNELRGATETNRFNMDGLATRSREQYLDLDGRVEALKKGGIIAAGGSGDGLLSADPRDVYQQAFELLKERRYEEARRGFADFVMRFPTNSLADNAYYWLGETSYVQGDYAAAVTQFQQVVEKFPESLKVADALLKIGMSQYELRQDKPARDNLNTVVSEFPDTTASRLATKQLEKMDKAGR